MENNKIWLSVIMPTWNGAKFLQDALESVSCQQANNIEIIVVDDGSTDDTIKILESYARKFESGNSIQIQIIQQQHTGNWVVNTNIGLSAAKGTYVSFLHQDDLWLSQRVHILKKMVKKYPDAILFLHPSYFIDRTGKRCGIWRCPFDNWKLEIGNWELENRASEFKFQISNSKFLILSKLLVQNFISIPAPCFQRKAIIKAGLLDEKLWYTADWKLWCQLSQMGEWHYYPYPLSCFRIHPTSLTAKGAENLVKFRHQIQAILDQFLPVLAESFQSDIKEQEKIISKINQLAEFSMLVNTAMAAIAWGQAYDWKELLKRGVGLGPLGWWQYIYYSRILERSMARIRAGFINLKSH